MAVTVNSVFTETWDQIYSLINSNVTDPTGKSKWLYSAYPDRIAEDKSTYPIIVINPIEASDSEPLTLTFGVKTFSLRVALEVYHTSAESLDQICSDVFSVIESNESTLAAQGIYNFTLSSSFPDTINRGKTRVHRKTLEWDFEFNKAG